MLVRDDSSAARLDEAAKLAVSMCESVQAVIGKNANPKKPAVKVRIIEPGEMKNQDRSLSVRMHD